MRKSQFIDINLVTPDPNQPRKHFEPQAVKELADSIKVEGGLIQPIEVDTTYTIIVGERRYRAVKFLGWDKIEVSVNDAPLTPFERFRRQMIENLQQSGSKNGGQPMSTVDTMKAWAHLYELKTGKVFKPNPFFLKDYKLRQILVGLAREIGVEPHTVWEYLRLLSEPKYVIEDLLKGRPRTYYREAQDAPEEMRDEIKKKIASGQYTKRDEIKKDVQVMKKLPELKAIIDKRKRNKESQAANKLLNVTTSLSLELTKTPLASIAAYERKLIREQLEWVKDRIDEYLVQ